MIGVGWFARQVLAADSIKAPKLMVAIPGLDFKQYPVIRKGNEISIPFLAAYIGAFYKYIVGASAIAAAVMIVWGGFLYIFGATSGGTSKGKEKIRDALIGLALILGSYTVLESINPSTLQFKPLTLTVITPQYLSHVDHMDGVPLDQMQPWERPDAPVAGSAPSTGTVSSGPIGGVSTSGLGKGCAVQMFYKLPPPKCSGPVACQKLFCEQKNYDFEGTPKAEELFGFDDFPATVGEQIAQKGLTFVTPDLCLGKKGCDATRYQSTILFGPRASVSIKNWMTSMRFRVEARDALIKAGQTAKAEGYFLAIGDGTRTMQTQAQNWCLRIRESGSPQGMALPGLSPHQLGIGVDIGLFKLDDMNKYHQLTVIGKICKQVTIQTDLGPDNLKKLEQIMASAGFKHMCSEVWHFDFRGVYKSDCDECDFPGEMGVRAAKEKQPCQ